MRQGLKLILACILALLSIPETLIALLMLAFFVMSPCLAEPKEIKKIAADFRLVELEDGRRVWQTGVRVRNSDGTVTIKWGDK